MLTFFKHNNLSGRFHFVEKITKHENLSQKKYGTNFGPNSINDLTRFGCTAPDEQIFSEAIIYAKCHSMRVTRHLPSNQIHFSYSLHQQTLEQVRSAKYLGLTITDDLEWGQHISEISCKATKTLCFLRRNLALAPRHTKEVAYKTLARPKLEYAAPIYIWHPYNETETKKGGKSAEDRWTCRRWRNRSSVDDMLDAG